LSEANIQIYKYENQKWWGRKEGKASSEEINEWDQISRSWNEKRSAIKNKIDAQLKDIVSKLNKNEDKTTEQSKSFSFQILPISLMIDMMTIENIKIFDLTNKGDDASVKKSASRRDELKKSIDESIEHILKTGEYKLEEEARTF